MHVVCEVLMVGNIKALEDSNILESDAGSLGEQIPTFLRIIVPCSSRLSQSKEGA